MLVLIKRAHIKLRKKLFKNKNAHVKAHELKLHALQLTFGNIKAKSKLFKRYLPFLIEKSTFFKKLSEHTSSTSIYVFCMGLVLSLVNTSV